MPLPIPLPRLSALQAFDAAARHENFRKAAEDLNVTQGAVAQQVRQLEAALGVALFTRHARGLRLTEPGALYAARLREALGMIEEATARITAGPDQLTLSVPPSFASKWLMPRLPAFLEANPELRLQTLATEQRAEFARDGVHVAVRQGRRPEAPGFVVERIAPLDLVAVAAPGRLPPARGLADLAGVPLIQDGHALWESYFAAAGMALPARVLRFNQTALAVDAAGAGQGVALAPRLLVRDALAQGALVQVWAPPAGEPAQAEAEGFFLIHPERGRAPEGRAALIGWLKREMAG
ncbi:Glycine cleavage system transcriptional activator [Pseudoruegeria aquimaris]|uniref:Glycine cleavage system transcriptional activator n=1 Tax=Pseudoruegeria aquimaris TaxID=393663 RepID=A0A1Y5RB68_9RHOB|nr:LysR substrate-binding domain-containing protein [Pseudoruegeria aquimaris]SLN13267.1 Glycine cleavage system transcriptional activator [Pseudoruegeria aquimaris]